jgi:anti-sigma regulatory factor (Ser/Thr protein kinase)
MRLTPEAKSAIIMESLELAKTFWETQLVLLSHSGDLGRIAVCEESLMDVKTILSEMEENVYAY